MLDQPDAVVFATALFNDSAAKAAVGQLSIQDLFARAAQLKGLNQENLVADLYKRWIAHNPDHQFVHAAYFNFGIALAEIGDRAGTVNALRECTRLRPDFYPPYINLGRALEDDGLPGPAVAEWMRLNERLAAVNGESVTHKCMALQQIGRVLEGLEKDAAAEDALKQSLDVNIAQPEVIQHWLALRQRQCKWPVVAPWERADRKRLVAGISPLSLANLADDPMFQLATAARYNRHSIGFVKSARSLPFHAPELRRGEKLKIGYLSSDLREHAVGFSLTDLMEVHDRGAFELHAYYCGISREDSTKARIRSNVDKWTDITSMNDEQAAEKIAADGIHILVDFNGYTKSARTKVFAFRPAPVIVNWFGFPGTMGSPYHQYIIADDYVIPPDQEMYYSEKVLRLPCYQPNDRRRVVAETPPRQAEGLPEDAVVYCCLNGMQKLTPLTFARWMSILNQVENSVLWLLSGTPETNDRIRALATANGVAAERIIFAEKKANPHHVARYALADMFLDNIPYGAHTTAADALWMGVPIVTLPGRSFASRVCASLLQAIGLDELICASPEAYVATAIELGRDRARLQALRAKLRSNRDSSLLFDTPRLARSLEDLYRQMWSDHEADRTPVPDLSNLDIYHEIGCELDLENMELVSDDAYRALYRDKLQAWNSTYPIRPDQRLWKPAAKPSAEKAGTAPRAQAVRKSR